MKNAKEDSFISVLTGQYELIDEFVKLPEKGVTELDLGCGKGSFSTKLALKYPERTILSADIMTGRLRKLVKRNIRENADNVFPLRTEARMLISRMLPDRSINRMHVLCPDPWPKNRHKDNRLICSDFMDSIFRVLKTGGVFHYATDDDYYFNAVEKLISETGIFEKDLSAIEDIKEIKSDFELRWLEDGRTVDHTAWIKKNSTPPVTRNYLKPGGIQVIERNTPEAFEPIW